MQNIVENKTEDFLQEYSKLEGLLKKVNDVPDTVLEYENKLDTENSERLKLCRQIRNYCRHHEDYKKFILVSADMLKFIQNLNFQLESNFLHVSDRTKKIKAVKGTDTISTALQIISKSPTDYIAVVDNDNLVLGFLDTDTIIKELINVSFKQTTKLNKIKYISDKKRFNLIEETKLLNDIDINEPYIVVNNKGKYKGLLVL